MFIIVQTEESYMKHLAKGKQMRAGVAGPMGPK